MKRALVVATLCSVVPAICFAADPLETALIEKIRAARRSGDLTTAITLAEDCAAKYPHSADCAVIQGSVLASAGSERLDDQLNDRAKAAYRRFLALAEPTDRRVERVKAILSGEPTPPARVAATLIELKPKERRTLKIAATQRIALGDAAIADVRAVGGNLIEIVGLKPGTTTLLVWTQTGQEVFDVRVLPAK
jgi:Flp pilus assembly secretin CpaC